MKICKTIFRATNFCNFNFRSFGRSHLSCWKTFEVSLSLKKDIYNVEWRLQILIFLIINSENFLFSQTYRVLHCNELFHDSSTISYRRFSLWEQEKNWMRNVKLRKSENHMSMCGKRVEKIRKVVKSLRNLYLYFMSRTVSVLVVIVVDGYF